MTVPARFPGPRRCSVCTAFASRPTCILDHLPTPPYEGPAPLPARAQRGQIRGVMRGPLQGWRRRHESRDGTVDASRPLRPQQRLPRERRRRRRPSPPPWPPPSVCERCEVGGYDRRRQLSPSPRPFVDVGGGGGGGGNDGADDRDGGDAPLLGPPSLPGTHSCGARSACTMVGGGVVRCGGRLGRCDHGCGGRGSSIDRGGSDKHDAVVWLCGRPSRLRLPPFLRR